MLKKKNPILIISGPSGVGKDSIIREIEKIDPKYQRMVTCTSRPKNEQEVEGDDYFFLSKSQFESYIKDGAFVEWTMTHGHYYGSLTRELNRLTDLGKIIIMPADVKGLLSFKQKYKKVLSVFIKTDSIDDLITRIKKRHRDFSEADLKVRMKTAEYELTMAKNYDYVVVNRQDCLKQTVQEILKIAQKYFV